MAFRFKLGEPLDEGVRRISREQIERAQAQLKGPDDPVVAVHETRKSLKRLRALLRLVRPALGEASYREENARLREIGRGLSSTRDRHVLLETLLKLEASAAPARKSLCQAVREALHLANGNEIPAVEAAAMKLAHARLGDAKRRLAELQLEGKGFDIVGAGLEGSYRKARRAFHRAYAEPSDEAFHEWRKGAQQHWRHMALLSRAWEGSLNARVAEARALSQLLGDDHDLALLVAHVHSEPASGLSGHEIAGIEKLARQRQDELRAVARPRGLRLFAEGGRGLRRRMAAYWEAAVALKEQEPDDAKPNGASREAAKKPPRQPQSRKRTATAQPT